MKKLALVMGFFYALPVQALTVSNLDSVPYYVVFEEVLGSKKVKQVKPGESIHSAASGGAVYLRDKPETIVRIEELDRLAIWPGGNLQIQMRRNRRAGN